MCPVVDSVYDVFIKHPVQRMSLRATHASYAESGHRKYSRSHPREVTDVVGRRQILRYMPLMIFQFF